MARRNGQGCPAPRVEMQVCIDWLSAAVTDGPNNPLPCNHQVAGDQLDPPAR